MPTIQIQLVTCVWARKLTSFSFTAYVVFCMVHLKTRLNLPWPIRQSLLKFLVASRISSYENRRTSRGAVVQEGSSALVLPTVPLVPVVIAGAVEVDERSGGDLRTSLPGLAKYITNRVWHSGCDEKLRKNKNVARSAAVRNLVSNIATWNIIKNNRKISIQLLSTGSNKPTLAPAMVLRRHKWSLSIKTCLPYNKQRIIPDCWFGSLNSRGVSRGNDSSLCWTPAFSKQTSIISYATSRKSSYFDGVPKLKHTQVLAFLNKLHNTFTQLRA